MGDASIGDASIGDASIGDAIGFGLWKLISSGWTIGGAGGVGVFWTMGFRMEMMSPKLGRCCGSLKQVLMMSFSAGFMSSVRAS